MRVSSRFPIGPRKDSTDDLGGPALREAAETYKWKVLAESLVADEKQAIQRAIREQIGKGCQLILTHRRHRGRSAGRDA